MNKSVLVVSAASALVIAGLIACAPPQKDNTGGETSSGVKVSEATSAADFGGIDALVAAAKKEGELNVIALPPDWANYGAIIKAFSDKYGIKVNSAQPDAASQDEINAANQQKGKSTAPDVFDLGQSVALANTSMFAPYKVANFDDIAAAYKDPNGAWVNDYGGYMSIGFDSAKVPPVTSVNDLLKPEYSGKVALNGDPTQAAAAFSGVLMVALSQGGSADDIAPGVEFFRKLKGAGNFLPVDPTPATDRVGPDTGGDRLELPERGRDQEAALVAGGGSAGQRRRRLLLPGHQQGRPASCRGAPVAGVPLQRRGAESVRRRWCPAGARRHHDGRRDHRQGGRGSVADHRRSCHRPVAGPDREGHQVSGGQLGEGDRLT